METFKFTEEEIDLLHEALTMYAEASAEGSYEYSEAQCEALIKKLGYDD